MASVFADKREDMFSATHVELQFLGKLVGGAPNDPKLVEGWIRKNTGIEDEEEITRFVRNHLIEMGIEIPSDASWDDLQKAFEKAAQTMKTQGFKRFPDGTRYIESRQIKAGIKECVNILFAKEKWGKTGKGPKNFVAETVFVSPSAIVVGDEDDVQLELFLGHLKGPQGPYSTIGYFECIERPRVEFTIVQARIADEAMTYDRWGSVMAHMEMLGLGAMRSQGFGQFETIAFEPGMPLPELSMSDMLVGV